ncbi:MAG: hypothetical protein J7474_09075, partial [Arthrobacter sp.]|nr:hypothetical protein [Arthrobacter sp.]
MRDPAVVDAPVTLKRAVRRMAGLLAVAKAVLRSRDEELERRLLLRETTHDVRLVPVLCLLWGVSAVTAARDEALLRGLFITGAAVLCAAGLWWFLAARRLRRPTRRRRRSVAAGLVLGVLVALVGCLLGLVRTADPGQRQLWSAVR